MRHRVIEPCSRFERSTTTSGRISICTGARPLKSGPGSMCLRPRARAVAGCDGESGAGKLCMIRSNEPEAHGTERGPSAPRTFAGRMNRVCYWGNANCFRKHIHAGSLAIAPFSKSPSYGLLNSRTHRKTASIVRAFPSRTRGRDTPQLSRKVACPPFFF